MGQSSTYKCNKCSYSVQTSAGLDWGFLAVVETYTCLKCKEVVDVLVGEHGNVIPKGVLERYPDKILPDSDFYKCPLCGDDSALKKWDADLRPCPQCDGRLEVDESAGVILWD